MSGRPGKWWHDQRRLTRFVTWTRGLLGPRRRRITVAEGLPCVGSADGEDIRVCPSFWLDAYEPWCRCLATLGVEVPGDVVGEDGFTWAATKGVAAHEVGHTRFSGPYPKDDRRLRALTNRLDDERVERGMSAMWPGLEAYFRLAGLACWLMAPPVTTAEEAVLLYRWEHDLIPGLDSKMRLSQSESARWGLVRPLVERAWGAATPEALSDLAAEIYAILQEHDRQPTDGEPHDPDEGSVPEAGLGEQEGLGDGGVSSEEAPAPAADARRGSGSEGADAPAASPAGGQNLGPLSLSDDSDADGGEGEAAEPLPFAGDEFDRPPARKDQELAEREALCQALDRLAADRQREERAQAKEQHDESERGDGRLADTGAHPLERADPAPIMPEARAMAQRLIAVLGSAAPEARLDRQAVGGRFSARDFMRTPATPFLEEHTVPGQDLTLEVWCDRSGSMGWSGAKIENGRLGVMALMLACQSLGIPTGLAFFQGRGRPEWILAKDWGDPLAQGTLEQIAGWSGIGDEYLLSLMQAREPRLLQAAAAGRRPAVLVVHDGYPVHDREAIMRWVRTAVHKRICVIGVYLGTDETEAERMRDIFPHVIVARPETFPRQLGTVLRRLAK